jgi:hypothetical protein
MVIVVKDLQKWWDGYENIKGDLIGDLGNADTSKVDTNKYLYYIVKHSSANIKEIFTDIQKARRFSLNFDAKNKENGYPTTNIDNIVGVKEEI